MQVLNQKDGNQDTIEEEVLFGDMRKIPLEEIQGIYTKLNLRKKVFKFPDG